MAPDAQAPPSPPAEVCANCRRALYGLQTVGTMKVCGRSDCLRVALAAARARPKAA